MPLVRRQISTSYGEDGQVQKGGEVIGAEDRSCVEAREELVGPYEASEGKASVDSKIDDLLVKRWVEVEREVKEGKRDGAGGGVRRRRRSRSTGGR